MITKSAQGPAFQCVRHEQLILSGEPHGAESDTAVPPDPPAHARPTAFSVQDSDLTEEFCDTLLDLLSPEERSRYYRMPLSQRLPALLNAMKGHNLHGGQVCAGALPWPFPVTPHRGRGVGRACKHQRPGLWHVCTGGDQHKPQEGNGSSGA